MRRSFLVRLLVVLFSVFSSQGTSARALEPDLSDDGLWTEVKAPSRAATTAGVPRTLALDSDRLARILDATQTSGSAAVVSLPLPQGGFRRFALLPSRVECPGFQGAKAAIAVFSGTGLDDPAEVATLVVSAAGVQAALSIGAQRFVVDPLPGESPGLHRAVDPSELPDPEPIRCATERAEDRSAPIPGFSSEEPFPSISTAGRSSKRLRLVLAGTGDYVRTVGGEDAARAVMATSVAFANDIFRRELGVELCVQGYLLYPTVSCGPRTPPPCRGAVPTCDRYAGLSDNAAILDTSALNPDFGCFGDADLGHVFATTREGKATIGSVCHPSGGLRNRGVTGLFGRQQFFRTSLAFVHELGHQLGATHTFAATKGACEGARELKSAVEPGSGSTLMSYAGSCESRLQNQEDDYFHLTSLSRMIGTLRPLKGCGAPGEQPLAALSISAPTVVRVPKATPFTLSARPGPGVATVGWEEMDGASSEGHPFFRSFPPAPASSPARTFPRPGPPPPAAFHPGETLPKSAVSLAFAATARDNRGGLGVALTKVEVLGEKAEVVPRLVCGKFALGGEKLRVEWPALPRFSCDSLRLSIPSGPLVGVHQDFAGSASGAEVALPQVAADTEVRFRLGCLVEGAETFSVESGEVAVRKDDLAPEILGQCTAKAGSLEVACDVSATKTKECAAIASFEWFWNWTPGAPGPAQDSQKNPKVGHAYDKPGRYNIRLRVLDSLGNTAVRDFPVELSAANRPPTARCDVQDAGVFAAAGATPPPTRRVAGVAPFKVAMTSRSEDPEGPIARCNWDFGAGPGGDGCALSHEYRTPGTYRVRLRVWDLAGLQKSDECEVKVEPNLGPTAALAARPKSGTAELSVTLDAGASRDPERRALRYEWTFGDGSAGTTTEAASIGHLYPRGTWTAAVAVVDDVGHRDAATIEIHADGEPEAAFTFSLDELAAPLPVSFDGRGSRDPEGRPLSYFWQFGDGGEGTGPSVRHTYAKPGSYVARLKVRDAFGLEDETERAIRVNGRPEVSLAAEPGDGIAPLDVTLSAEAIDPDGERLSFAWDFGDGERLETSDATVAHRYAAGDFTASVTATDPHGAQARATAQVNVQPPRLGPDPWYLCDHPGSMTAWYSPGAGIFFHRVGWQEQVWIAGVRYDHAIGMHPGVNPANPDQGSAWAEFRIPPGARTFRTIFGMARQDIHPNDYGEALGGVSIDGRTVWSGMLRGPNRIVLPPIAIPAGAQTLRLFVDSAGSRWSDHTTWADPRFTASP